MIRFAARLFVSAVVAALAASAAVAQEKTIVLRAARLIDGTGAAPIENPIVVIAGGELKAVGRAGSVTVAAGATVIDLPGHTLLPGLMDCHDHMTGMPGDGGDTAQLRETDAHKAIYGVANAKITLDAGFTTVRDVGAGGFADVALRDLIEKGIVPGPRMYVATRGLGATGGHADINGWSPHLPIPGIAQMVDGIDSARRAVREQIKFGADHIKVTFTGGVLSAGDSVHHVQLSFEELQAIVEEAGRWGRRVAAHAHAAKGIALAAKAGVASIEHGSLIDDEGIQAMKQHGTYVVPTLYTLDFIVNEGEQHGVPEYGIAKAKLVGRTQRANLRRAFEAGVKFAYGTDAAVFPHGRNARDFAILVRELGVPPMEAIRMATAHAADLIGITDKVGTLQAGKWADVIAVQGNPLDDIRLLEDVKFVMKQGVVHKRPTGR